MSKIKVGIIGCGGNSRGHGRRLSNIEEAEIVALTDVSDGSLSAYRESVPDTEDLPIFHDYKEMLDSVEMDAVEISTPHTLHFEHITASLDKGLHVLTEKPMVCTVEHAKAVIEKVEETGKHMMVSYQRHFSPIHVYCHNVLSSGELGPPHFISTHQSQNWVPATKHWRGEPELSGGGQLNDSGSHLLDILLWITGLKTSEVFAYMDNRGTKVDVLSAISLKFDGGTMGNISIVGDSIGGMHEDLSIWCSKGTLMLKEGRVFRDDLDDGFREVPRDEMPAGNNPDRAFIDLLLGKAENRVPPECGLRVIELTEAAWKSAEVGEPVKVE